MLFLWLFIFLFVRFVLFWFASYYFIINLDTSLHPNEREKEGMWFCVSQEEGKTWEEL